MTTMVDAPDPCGCHTSFAEHQVMAHQPVEHEMILPTTTEVISHQAGTMEFDLVNVWRHEAPMSPLVPILLFLTFAAAFIRHCRGRVRYITFRRLLLPTDERAGPALVRENLILAIQSHFTRVRLHKVEGEIRCAYCKDTLTDTIQAFCCSECATFHHRECYLDHCGCAVFGCRLSGSAS